MLFLSKPFIYHFHFSVFSFRFYIFTFFSTFFCYYCLSSSSFLSFFSISSIFFPIFLRIFFKIIHLFDLRYITPIFMFILAVRRRPFCPPYIIATTHTPRHSHTCPELSTPSTEQGQDPHELLYVC